MPSTEYTVEITVMPVLDDDWDRHYAVIDQRDGTILYEDPIEPMFTFIIEGVNDIMASEVALGTLRLLGIVHTKICVTRTEWMDTEFDDEVEDASHAPWSAPQE